MRLPAWLTLPQMTRVFLMRWYHYSVEYFEDLRNVNHCEFLIMRRQSETGKYILENNLRTWSELRRERERAALLKQKEEEESSAPKVGEPARASVVMMEEGGKRQ